MENTNYIQIQGWMINELELKSNELIVYALIYGFCQDGESEFTGSINYICKALRCSRPTAINVLKNLVEKGFLVKRQETVNSVTFNRYKVFLGVVKKFNEDSKVFSRGVVKKSNEGSKETLPNNTINNTNTKTLDNRKADFKKSLLNFQNEYSNDLLKDFFGYWTEHGERDKKMKYEKEKSFGISRRLTTWAKNQKRFEQNAPAKNQTAAQALRERIYGTENN